MGAGNRRQIGSRADIDTTSATHGREARRPRMGERLGWQKAIRRFGLQHIVLACRHRIWCTSRGSHVDCNAMLNALRSYLRDRHICKLYMIYVVLTITRTLVVDLVLSLGAEQLC